jgi:hypothetical protein
MWELILKADVEFFDKEAAKKLPDTLGYYEHATDTIYLNQFAIFEELKRKNVKVSDVSVINRIIAVLNHEIFHAAAHPVLKEHIRQFIKKNITTNENMVGTLEHMLINTIGIIWQEVGVRVYQEGQHPDQAIANVLRADGGYRKKIQDNIRELEYFASVEAMRGENIYVAMVKFVEDYVVKSIKAMLEKLKVRLNETIKRISRGQQ